MLPESLHAITEHVRARSGIVLDESKAYMLETRLAPILRREGLPSLDDLARRLRMARQEELGRVVVEALTTNESLFFRDGHPFDHLARALPRLAARLPAGQPVRVWSAACSSGQEAYSVAMLATENAAALGGRAVRILGTDLSREMVERAGRGAFTRFEVQRGLSVHRLLRFFRQEGEQFLVKEELR
ncbi:MAG TPA: CheR family methyltransferase, partial [Acetobacteraceae bacterium]|nr:CheR family methyltransferase [Acetobacteraceae bacterium]